MSIRDQIYRSQREWAESAGHKADGKGYLRRPEDNLPWLCTETRSEIEAGDGNEFGRDGKLAKIAALHSSSALAVNVFDYWRTRSRSPLRGALKFEDEIVEIRFEQKFPTGVGPRDPNLDVVIRGARGEMLAIESKFCESFASGAKTLREAYFAGGAERWGAAGLSGAQGAADAIRRANPFKYLDAPQLLKHMLGLARSESDWRLMLLWFVPSPALQADIDAEVEEFKLLLGQDAARFSSLSYHALWNRLVTHSGAEHAEYLRYLGQRYFGAAR